MSKSNHQIEVEKLSKIESELEHPRGKQGAGTFRPRGKGGI